VAYHIGLPGFSGGFVGVDIFFVLSGYLITGLLVREAGSSGRVSFRRFYARRIRRLLPVSVVVLLTTLVISALLYSPIEMKQISSTAASVALYVSNFTFATRAVSYLGGATVGADPYLHTWSLAVEEQFYLVWPLFIAALVWAGTRFGIRRRALAGGMLVMAVVSFAACAVLTNTHQSWAFFASPPRFWEFAVGGLAALAPVSWFARIRVAKVLTVLGAVTIAVPIVAYGSSTRFPGAAALVPVAGTVMLLLADSAGVEPRVGRPLRTRAALWFGERSYSWYLWHWPALIFAAVLWPKAGLVVNILAVMVALGASMLTFRYVEQRVRHNGYLAMRPRKSIAFGAAASVLCVLIAVGFSARAEAATKTTAQARINAVINDNRLSLDCTADVLSPGSRCGIGDVNSEKTIALFGDSHAWMFNEAFDRIGRVHGYRVVPLELRGCPPADVKTFFSTIGRVYNECTQWRAQAFTAIEKLHPDLVVFSSSAEFYTGLPGHESSTGLAPDDWTQGIERTASRLDKMGLQFAMIADVPEPGFHVPNCLSRRLGAVIVTSSCSFDRNLIAPAGRTAAREVDAFKDGTVIDLTKEICPTRRCKPTQNGMVKYMDGNHLANPYVTSLAGPIWDRLDAVLVSAARG
jgi:peptidoglycan/LPS O-acetylase OafA/YrhL